MKKTIIPPQSQEDIDKIRKEFADTHHYHPKSEDTKQRKEINAYLSGEDDDEYDSFQIM